MAKKRVDVIIGVKNKMRSGLKQATRSLSKFNRTIQRSMRSVGLSFKRMFAGAAIGFAALIKHGNAFRQSMAEVSTMLGQGSTALPLMTKQVRELSAEFGVAKKTLAEGLYNALSAGVPADNAIDFLRTATKSAVGGVTDVATAVDGLTTVLNAYGMSADRVGSVSDILFQVVKEGKITFGELAENVGKIAPTARVAGVELRDLSAMIATLVKIEKPERAMTALSQAMFYAADKGKSLMEVMRGFEGVNLEDLLEAGVNKKAAAGIALMASNMGVLRKEMALFKDTAGAADEAFRKIGAVRHWQKIWQSVLALVARTGEVIDSSLAPAINRAAAWIRNFGDSPRFDTFIDRVREAADLLGEISIGLATGTVGLRQTLGAVAGVFTAAIVDGATLGAKILKDAMAPAWYKRWQQGVRERQEHRNRQSAGWLMSPRNWLSSERAPIPAATEKSKTESALENLVAVVRSTGPLVGDGMTPKQFPNWKPGKWNPLTKRYESGSLSPAGTGATAPSMTPVVPDSAPTNLIGIGELFTLMQTGQQRETELSEAKRTNSLLEEIRDEIKDGGLH